MRSARRAATSRAGTASFPARGAPKGQRAWLLAARGAEATASECLRMGTPRLLFPGLGGPRGGLPSTLPRRVRTPCKRVLAGGAGATALTSRWHQLPQVRRIATVTMARYRRRFAGCQESQPDGTEPSKPNERLVTQRVMPHKRLCFRLPTETQSARGSNQTPVKWTAGLPPCRPVRSDDPIGLRAVPACSNERPLSGSAWALAYGRLGSIAVIRAAVSAPGDWQGVGGAVSNGMLQTRSTSPYLTPLCDEPSRLPRWPTDQHAR